MHLCRWEGAHSITSAYHSINSKIKLTCGSVLPLTCHTWMDYCDICIVDAAKQSSATGIDTATCAEQCDM